MISVYSIKPQFQRILTPILELLHRAKVTANQITWRALHHNVASPHTCRDTKHNVYHRQKKPQPLDKVSFSYSTAYLYRRFTQAFVNSWLLLTSSLS